MQSDSDDFAILGAGFGLYGYLPAILNVLGGRILLPLKYRNKYYSRIELQSYSERIKWLPSVEAALQEATGVVIALPPHAQFEILHDILPLSNVKKIIMEKPIAPSPAASIQIINALSLTRKMHRVGYIFIQSDWYRLLSEYVVPRIKSLKIIWEFEAHHLVNNKDTWKRYHSLGGGVLRFYGIHLIAVLASLGYQKPTGSILLESVYNQPTNWKANYEEESLPDFETIVSMNSPKAKFQIICIDTSGFEQVLYSSTSPFSFNNQEGEQDARVIFLERLIKTFQSDNSEYYRLYRNTINLWQKLELLSPYG